MFVLHQQKHVVRKGRKGGESAAESGNQENVHLGRDEMGFFCHTEENANNKTTDYVYGKGAPRER